jgi:Arc/MetJ-type ribon-helix-helix transcriptional regulator
MASKRGGVNLVAAAECRYIARHGVLAMTITVVLKNEAAAIVERQVSEGRYPDAESAVAAAIALLEDANFDWSEVDVPTVQRMLKDADDEGGELTRDEVSRHLDAAIDRARRG